jgi:hypothetical protein
MFGRGNWAIVGLAKESLEAFRTSLADRTIMVAASRTAASAVTRHFNGVGVVRGPHIGDDRAGPGASSDSGKG